MDDYYYDMDGFAAGMGAFFAFLLVFFAVMAIIFIAMYVYTSLAYMKMYQKAGHPNPWGAWVPFYREYLLFEHGGVNGWYYIIACGASFVLSGIASAVSFTGEIGAIGSIASYDSPDYYSSGVGTGAIIIGGILSFISYLPAIAVFVLQIFVVINLSRAFSRPGAGMIVLGILVPVVWIGILAWGKASVWRPEMAIHGTRGLFFPRQGKTYLERQITARFGGQMPVHAQQQPKAQPQQAQQQYQQQAYPQQTQQQAPVQQQQQAYPAQPQTPSYPQQPVQPQAPVQPQEPTQQDPAQPAAQPPAPQAPGDPATPDAPAPGDQPR